MPQHTNPKCLQCDKTESMLWRNIDNGLLCHECYEQNNTKIELEPESDNGSTIINGHYQQNGEKDNSKTRKSTRTTRFKPKTTTCTATKASSKGRGRRYIFKKQTPFKSPIVPVSTRTVESVFYNGSYMQIGDIVSLMDDKDNLYYAQVRALLIDIYCEKSAFLTWLIPTQSSPPPNERFDPSTYLIGPEEDSPRSLSCLEFVMHAPSNYYHDKTTPFPPPDSMDFSSNPAGFIWTSLNEQATNRK